MTSFTVLLLSMFITLGLIPILTRMAMHYQLVDVPDARKVHSVPIPRIGGVAIAFGAIVPILFQIQFNQFTLALLGGVVVIVFFGAIDDIIGLGHVAKFAGQIGAALVVCLSGDFWISNLGSCLPEGCMLPQWLSLPLTVLVIVAVTNAVNLADGLDGLAGGIMALVFICLGLLAYNCGNSLIVLLCIAVTGAIFGFLRFNTHPASVFMGDTGSQLIGFLAITLALAITQADNALCRFLPIVLLGFPITDTAVVMMERIRRGKSPFKADKNHFHHKLLQMNLYHREAVFVIYMVQTIFVGSAFFFRFYSEPNLLVTYLVLVLLLLVPVYFTSNSGFKFIRTGIIDNLLKRYLRLQIKESRIYLRVSQLFLTAGIPSLLLFTVMVPASTTTAVTFVSASLFLVIAVSSFLNSRWTGSLVRGTAYVLLPLVFFQCFIQTADWVTEPVLYLFILSYAALVFVAVLLLKYTRRKKGFQPTPTDFLIVLLAVVLPNLSDYSLSGTQLGFWGTCLIVFFFSLEVLLGELRNEERQLGFSVLPALGILVFRGIV